MIDYVFIVLGEYSEGDKKEVDILLVTASDEESARYVNEWREGKSFQEYINVYREDHNIE